MKTGDFVKKRRGTEIQVTQVLTREKRFRAKDLREKWKGWGAG